MVRPRKTGVFATLAIAVCCIQASSLIAQDQNDAADATRLIDVLKIRPGSIVADVGAGSGLLTAPVARVVGPNGRIYATDINSQRLEELRQLAAASGENVVVIEGGLARTNLPDECCDAIFMRLVYHHFGDPPAMNASLYRSLKRGGRLAVVDFAPRSGNSAPAGRRDSGEAHGVAPMTVVEELSAAGFIAVQRVDWPSPPGFLVIAERP